MRPPRIYIDKRTPSEDVAWFARRLPLAAQAMAPIEMKDDQRVPRGMFVMVIDGGVNDA